MWSLFWPVLIASLVGSPHCAGMCGGLVAFCVGASNKGQRLRAQLAYHLSRLLSYSLLGAMAGLLGKGIDLGGSALGIKQFAIVFAGGFMILFGVLSLIRNFGGRLPKLPSIPFVNNLFSRATTLATKLQPVHRSAVIGLLTALLPCGWLYAFVVTAAAAANPLGGALVMAAFWLGTVPVLATVGAGVQVLAGSMAKYLPTFTALLLVGVGLWTIFGRLQVPDYAQKIVQPQNLEQAIEHLHDVNQTAPACCEEDEQ